MDREALQLVWEASDEAHRAWLEAAYTIPASGRRHGLTDLFVDRLHLWKPERIAEMRRRSRLADETEATPSFRVDCGRRIPRAPRLDELDERNRFMPVKL